MSDTRIEAGELRLELRIEEDVATDATNSTGEHVPEWRAWGSPAVRWAALRQLRGREIERAMLQGVEVTHLITLRYVSGIKALKFRGRIGSRIFSFGVVNNVDEANIKLEIMAAEIQA